MPCIIGVRGRRSSAASVEALREMRIKERRLIEILKRSNSPRFCDHHKVTDSGFQLRNMLDINQCHVRCIVKPCPGDTCFGMRSRIILFIPNADSGFPRIGESVFKGIGSFIPGIEALDNLRIHRFARV